MIASLEIDLAAIRTNATALRKLVAPARVAAVVKANAYGHGLVETARALDGVVDRLCVYALEEAVALRDAGVAAPLLVLGPIPAGDLEVAHAAGAAITLWDTGTYARMVASVARRRRAPFHVHAKLDTGLSRLGLPARTAQAALERYFTTPELTVEGMYSHLASAEELDSGYTMRQIRELEAAARPFAERVRGGSLVRHIAASAAAMLWPQARLEMIRTGIALYGLWPSPETRKAMPADGFTLVPALSWRTELVATRPVEAGQAIGYGCTYHAPRPATIGIVPIGYAEGLPRAAGNRGAMLVDGVRCPIVGRICMDMAFLDVTAAPNARPGSVVTLIGEDGDMRISADDWGGWCETINYEIVARLPREIPRRYVDSGRGSE